MYFIRILTKTYCVTALFFSFLSQTAFAQEANVLGLPAVPQPKPGAVVGTTQATPPASNSSTPKLQTGTYPERDVLSGEMGLQHSALNGLGRLIMTTRATFATAGAQSAAIDAGRSVQRGLGKSCLKQCMAEKMSAPKILPSGQMQFELLFRPLYQHLNQAQYVAALQSKPLNLTPAQIQAPMQTSIPTPTLALKPASVFATTNGIQATATDTK
jgi:hypothetical protein